MKREYLKIDGIDWKNHYRKHLIMLYAVCDDSEYDLIM